MSYLSRLILLRSEQVGVLRFMRNSGGMRFSVCDGDEPVWRLTNTGEPSDLYISIGTDELEERFVFLLRSSRTITQNEGSVRVVDQAQRVLTEPTELPFASASLTALT